LSWVPGRGAGRSFDRSFQARPLAVLVAEAGASATSAGAGGATGCARGSSSIGWAEAS
jgi:hypothetical protein